MTHLHCTRCGLDWHSEMARHIYERGDTKCLRCDGPLELVGDDGEAHEPAENGPPSESNGG